MKLTDLTDASLMQWCKRDSVSAVQAAFLLAEVEPVINPVPSLSGGIGVHYRHILHAVRRGELPAVGPVRYGGERDNTYRDYLDPSDWHKYRRQWTPLRFATDIDPDAEPDSYRFEIEPGILFTWWSANADPVSISGASSIPNDAFYIAALRLSWAGGAPNCTKVAFHRALQTSGITGLPSEKTLRVPFDRAKEGGEINYPDKSAGPAKEPIKALFIYAASQHGKKLENARPAEIHRVLIELLKEYEIPAPKDNLPWEAIDLL